MGKKAKKKKAAKNKKNRAKKIAANREQINILKAKVSAFEKLVSGLEAETPGASNQQVLVSAKKKLRAFQDALHKLPTKNKELKKLKLDLATSASPINQSLIGVEKEYYIVQCEIILSRYNKISAQFKNPNTDIEEKLKEIKSRAVFFEGLQKDYNNDDFKFNASLMDQRLKEFNTKLETLNTLIAQEQIQQAQTTSAPSPQITPTPKVETTNQLTREKEEEEPDELDELMKQFESKQIEGASEIDTIDALLNDLDAGIIGALPPNAPLQPPKAKENPENIAALNEIDQILAGLIGTKTQPPELSAAPKQVQRATEPKSVEPVLITDEINSIIRKTQAAQKIIKEALKSDNKKPLTPNEKNYYEIMNQALERLLAAAQTELNRTETLIAAIKNNSPTTIISLAQLGQNYSNKIRIAAQQEVEKERKNYEAFKNPKQKTKAPDVEANLEEERLRNQKNDIDRIERRYSSAKKEDNKEIEKLDVLNARLNDEYNRITRGRDKNACSPDERQQLKSIEDKTASNNTAINQKNLAINLRENELLTAKEKYYNTQVKSLTARLASLDAQINAKISNAPGATAIKESIGELSQKYNEIDTDLTKANQALGEVMRERRHVQDMITLLEATLPKKAKIENKSKAGKEIKRRDAIIRRPPKKEEAKAKPRDAVAPKIPENRLVQDLKGRFKKYATTEQRASALEHYKDIRDSYETKIELVQKSHFRDPEEQQNKFDALKAECEQLKMHLGIYIDYLRDENKKLEEKDEIDWDTIAANVDLIQKIGDEIIEVNKLIHSSPSDVNNLAHFSDKCAVITAEEAAENGKTLEQFCNDKVKAITGLSAGAAKLPSLSSEISKISTTESFRGGSALRVHDIHIKGKKDQHFHVAAVERLRSDNTYVQELYNLKKMKNASSDERLRFVAITVENKIASDGQPVVLRGDFQPAELVKDYLAYCAERGYQCINQSMEHKGVKPTEADVAAVKKKLNTKEFREVTARFGTAEKVLETEDALREKKQKVGLDRPTPASSLYKPKAAPAVPIPDEEVVISRHRKM